MFEDYPSIQNKINQLKSLNGKSGIDIDRLHDAVSVSFIVEKKITRGKIAHRIDRKPRELYSISF